MIRRFESFREYMKCCWCQQETEEEYVIKRNPRKPMSGVKLPICQTCKDKIDPELLPVGGESL